MRNQVIALENETDRMISVSVPVSVLILFCGYAIDNEVSGRIVVKTADNIQHCGLTASGMTKNSNKLVITECNINSVECSYLIFTRAIVLNDFFKLQHKILPFIIEVFFYYSTLTNNCQ